MEELIYDLKTQIEVELKRKKEFEDNLAEQDNGWSTEYHEGYIDGIKRTIELAKEFQSYKGI